jgi:basic membrane lipoprotein Med (substrate-binding protein (PBP1-ABC) superfamily)
MTRSLILFAGLVLALVAVGLAPAQGDQARVAYVVAGTAAEQPAIVERARETAARTGAQLRVPRTTADQLGVTHVLAASGYDTVITIGVDRRIAIDPVAARYPETRFIEARSIPAP